MKNIANLQEFGRREKKKTITLKIFSETDEGFKKACQKVGLPMKPMILKHGSKTVSVNHVDLNLKRQAGKWLRQKGLAYKEGR